MKLYTASKAIHAHKWRELRASGVNVISTWIDEAGEGESKSYKDLVNRCLSEISEAEALILYCESGEILKGALIEVGAAMAQNKLIFCVGNCPSLSRVFKAYGLWHPCKSIESAVALASYLCGYSAKPEMAI